MNIGEAAAQSGIPAKTIRYYEDIGLVTPRRAASGYREFDAATVRKLGFLGGARRLGFSIEDCRALLSLYEDRNRASADVKEVAERHIADIDARIAELRTMRDSLAALTTACHGDERPDCPILDGLAARPAPAVAR